jgi:hypothetical protein
MVELNTTVATACTSGNALARAANPSGSASKSLDCKLNASSSYEPARSGQTARGDGNSEKCYQMQHILRTFDM